MLITKERVKEILSKFTEKSILVVGDLILDKYLWGEVERISPEAPVPIVDVKKETVNLGGACNVAWNLSSLDVKTTIAGVVGKDENAKILKSLLQRKNINTILIEDKNRPTTEKTRVIAVSQQLLRIDRESKEKLKEEVREKLIKELKNQAQNFDAIIISDYGKGVISRDVIEVFLERNIPVFVDPKPSHFEYYKDITIMTPNRKEAYGLIKAKKEIPLEKVGKTIMEKLNLKNLLITLGAEGMALFTEDKITKIPAKARKVFDVTGAGDTVISVLTASKVSGATWEESAILANYAGSYVVGEIGTVAINRKTLISLVE